MENFMDLEKMDKEYGIARNVTDKSSKLNVAFEQKKAEVKKLSRDFQDLNIRLERAKEDKNNAEIKQCETDIKRVKDDFLKAKQSLLRLKSIIEKNLSTIDQHFEDISKDPELKAHLEKVVGTKFSRALLRNQKEKEARLNENATLSKITEAAKQDPNVMYMLKDLEKHLNDVKKLNAIISDPSKTPAEISQAQVDLVTANTSVEQSRSEIAKYFKGSISREVIDKITSYEDLEKNIKANNKYIAGIDKQNANYETALYNIGYLSPLDSRLANKNLTVKDFPIRDSENTLGTINQPANTSRRSQSSARINGDEEEQGGNLPATQPKWYQFIKRFKNWVNRRRAERESMEEEPEEENSNPSTTSSKTSFRDSMKYDVIKAYEEQFEKNLLRNAKEQNKAAQRDNDNQR